MIWIFRLFVSWLFFGLVCYGEGVVIVSYWEWFVIPSFPWLSPLSLSHAIGLSWLAMLPGAYGRLRRHKIIRDSGKERQDRMRKAWNDSMISNVAFLVATLPVSYGCGWLMHHWAP